MNILIAGGSKQSWDMRGKQLGKAMGAKVVSKPSEEDVRWADVVVLIKKGAFHHAELVHRVGKPLVWDALDFWEQPDQNSFTQREALVLFATATTEIGPTLTIGATQCMAEYAHNGVYLPHHSWDGLAPTLPRKEVRRVGYQGKPRYLGKWSEAIASECYKRGWEFVINPANLRECDILVAFRDGEWDGWMCQFWKSGIKAVNAVASGRPLIHNFAVGVQEIGAPGSRVEDPSALGECFDSWDAIARRLIYEQIVSGKLHERFSLGTIASQYRSILEKVS